MRTHCNYFKMTVFWQIKNHHYVSRFISVWSIFYELWKLPQKNEHKYHIITFTCVCVCVSLFPNPIIPEFKRKGSDQCTSDCHQPLTHISAFHEWTNQRALTEPYAESLSNRIQCMSLPGVFEILQISSAFVSVSFLRSPPTYSPRSALARALHHPQAFWIDNCHK